MIHLKSDFSFLPPPPPRPRAHTRQTFSSVLRIFPKPLRISPICSPAIIFYYAAPAAPPETLSRVAGSSVQTKLPGLSASPDHPHRAAGLRKPEPSGQRGRIRPGQGKSEVFPQSRPPPPQLRNVRSAAGSRGLAPPSRGQALGLERPARISERWLRFLVEPREGASAR